MNEAREMINWSRVAWRYATFPAHHSRRVAYRRQTRRFRPQATHSQRRDAIVGAVTVALVGLALVAFALIML